MIYDYPSLLNDILRFGSVYHPRGQEIRELIHVHLEIEPYCNLYSFPEVRPKEKIIDYSKQELAWYLSGDRSPDFIQNKAKLWSKILNPDGTLNSNYGYLVFYNSTPHPSMGGVSVIPFAWALYSLLMDKDSRQAIITYNNGGYNFPENHDYICTQHQSFLIRENILRCFIALRSSDAIFGLPFNYLWWSFVYQRMFLMLLPYYPELKLGSIEVDIYSAHIYKHHYELVEKMLSRFHEKYFVKFNKIVPLGLSLNEYLETVDSYYEIEKR